MQEIITDEKNIIIDLRDSDLEQNLKEQKRKQFQNVKLFIYLIIGLILLSTASAYYSRGAYGSGIYGRNLVIERVEILAGGISSILNINATPALLTGSCSEGNQYLNGACYPCKDGTLYKRKDSSVVCVVCGENAYYKDGNCLPKPETIFMDYWKTPQTALILIVVVGLIIGSLGYVRKELRKKEEKPEEEPEEETDDILGFD